jgi:diacylglycerol kinase
MSGLWLLRCDKSIQIELIIGIPMLIFSNVYKPGLTTSILFSMSFVLLIAVEILNTAIEKICNRITKDWDLDIKNIKDIASSAVFLLILLNIALFFLVIKLPI